MLHITFITFDSQYSKLRMVGIASCESLQENKKPIDRIFMERKSHHRVSGPYRDIFFYAYCCIINEPWALPCYQLFGQHRLCDN